MATAAALATSTVPTKLISIIFLKKAPAMAPCFPTNRAGVAMPAQLIAALIEPIRSRPRSIAPLTAASSLTSVAMKADCSPSAAAAAVPWTSFTSRSMTLPPACTIRFATAWPRPEAPPVTTACVSFSCMDEFSQVFEGCEGMRGSAPPVAEKGLDHGVGHLFNPGGLPLRGVVLVDDQSAHPFDKVALHEALLRHGEFHAKAGGEAQFLPALQLAQSDAQHGRRAAAHELGGLLRPIGIFGARFRLQRSQNGRHGGLREVGVDAGTQHAQG